MTLVLAYPVVTVTTIVEAEQRSKRPREPKRIPEPGNDLLIAGGDSGCFVN